MKNAATTWLLSDIAVGQLLIRMVATAIVVIGVAIAVGRLGPAVGGRLAGLPIVLGPGFFFLMRQADAAFVSSAAAHAILSLTATQLFLLVYVATARRVAPIVSLLLAICAWSAAAMAFRAIPAEPLAGIALFALVTLLAWQAGRVFVRSTPARRGAENRRLLLLRGLLAGLLVAVVTTLSDRLGPTGAGLLMAFPVGYTVLSVTLHEQMGADVAAATLHSAILGTISLAGFCGTLALLAPVLAGWGAYLAALAASLVITLALARQSGRRPQA